MRQKNLKPHEGNGLTQEVRHVPTEPSICRHFYTVKQRLNLDS
jgi:hypothetical protein